MKWISSNITGIFACSHKYSNINASQNKNWGRKKCNTDYCQPNSTLKKAKFKTAFFFTIVDYSALEIDKNSAINFTKNNFCNESRGRFFNFTNFFFQWREETKKNIVKIQEYISISLNKNSLTVSLVVSLLLLPLTDRAAASRQDIHGE